MRSSLAPKIPCAALLALLPLAALEMTGCATMKQSDTARTGIEQLLISTAADRALDQVDFRPVAQAKVFVETKYLDCVDKNYIIVGLHQRLLAAGCTLVEKPEEGEVILEVASGSVGTDRTDMFVGTPNVPLPPPSPIMIPKMPLMERTRAMGTAKLTVVAYDAKTKVPVINGGYALARSDHKTWNILGLGGMNSGTVHDDLANKAGDIDTVSVTSVARRARKAMTR